MGGQMGCVQQKRRQTQAEQAEQASARLPERTRAVIGEVTDVRQCDVGGPAGVVRCLAS